MANPYRELFSAPGSLAFAAAGLVARIPVPMTGIGIIAMLAQMRGDYGLAGAVSAAFTLSMALIAPQVSRLVDRLGQGRVLLPVTGISVASLGALLLCARYGAPVWTLFVFAVLAGFMPSMAAMVRARWSELYRDSPRLHTAFSLESVVDELTFVIGPALSVSLCTALFPEAGPLVAAVFLAVGVLLFVAQRRTEPVVVPAAEVTGGSAIEGGAVKFLVLVLVAGGVIVGTVDVVSVAFAEHLGQPAAAGIVVSVYALGSGLSGLVFGMRRLTVPLPRLLLVFTAGTALTTLPMLVVGGIPALSVTVFFAGIFFAPTMIVVMGMVEKFVPAGKLTEGMTWAITGLNIGVALGAAAAGQAIEAFGVQGGFVIAAGAGGLTFLVALLAFPLLRRKSREVDPVAV
ncbi:Predicted arabinose efflux permease, MFS family [Saccharopolyspora antimicrobica]|uniref:MFS family arabinose efflux permease n=1 Tax=Saccharopolyspora antimicrobica TaxID=455193 RepID=A0A1I4W6R3_9PSEU|nr:MFS transporter [Saccharopolyspora antimicrobica]RKT87032.1 putative MFS family arabinose efflux permease [Saccharopolyspora antimicrobica]SFN09291.1 Predicted arabinose efflux permease, MFS family [Saccharopolyspora antimicrobica]